MLRSKLLRFKTVNKFDLLPGKHLIVFIVTIAALTFSCSNTKRLTDSNALVVKNKVEIKDSPKEAKHARLERELITIARPRVNKKFLGTRFWQSVYNAGSKGDSLSAGEKFLQKIGKKPELLDTALMNDSNKKMQTFLQNSGYFDADVSNRHAVKNKKAAITYDVSLESQYKIGKLEFEAEDSVLLAKILRYVDEEKFITPGKAYDIDDLVDLREAIVTSMQNDGYYRFTLQSVAFEKDTTANSSMVDIYGIIGNPFDSLYNQQYAVDRIRVRTAVKPFSDLIETELNEKYFYQPDVIRLRNELLDQYIYLERGKTYSRSDRLATSERLASLPFVQYANVEVVDEKEVDGKYLVDLDITVRGGKLREISFAPEVSDFEGLAFTGDLSYNNKSLFRGGELLKLGLKGGFESFESRLFGTSFVHAEASLTFPRMMGLDLINPRIDTSVLNPRTRLKSGYGFQNRAQLYTISEFNLDYEWEWSTSLQNRHLFKIADISVFDTISIAGGFRSEILDVYPALNNSFQPRMILGGGYTYQRSSYKNSDQKTYYSVEAGIDYSGNIFNLLNRSDTAAIFGRPVAQFARTQLELVTHLKTGLNSKFVTRLVAGGAWQYGNPGEVPVIRQFFAGGSNSMRAWSPRTLGPGGYDLASDPNVDLDKISILDQRGEIKLEANAEYRFPMFQMFGYPLNGAMFIDVGNIWGSTEDERLNAAFSSNWMKELGIGTGFGFRFDFNRFLIRTDYAFKLRDPARAEGDRAIHSPFQLRNGQFNFGVGMPFGPLDR